MPASITMPDEAGLYRLLTWFSPAFPTGGFAYSHGLEYAVEAGIVADADSLADWIGAILEHGAGRNDAILFAQAWRAARAADWPALDDVAEHAAAYRGSAELAGESAIQGRAFLDIVAAVAPGPALDRLAQRLRAGLPPAHAAVAGAACGGAGLPLAEAGLAYLQCFVANLVSAGVRAIPLGQTAGQRVIARLGRLTVGTARAARAAALDDLGGAALTVDWCAMRHETQHTRLFRS